MCVRGMEPGLVWNTRNTQCKGEGVCGHGGRSKEAECRAESCDGIACGVVCVCVCL